jgi:hypothetical protein
MPFSFQLEKIKGYCEAEAAVKKEIKYFPFPTLPFEENVKSNNEYYFFKMNKTTPF